jgi:BlaI family penicillinase repressor
MSIVLTDREADVMQSALSHLTSKLFKGSVELLFAHVVSDKKLTAQQIRRMREILDEKPE